MSPGTKMQVDPDLAREIETAAAEMAWSAGRILAGHFGGQLAVEYKDEHQRDPVTQADKACQEHISQEIARRFPDHGILGEEGGEDGEDERPAPDYLWVLDPLDGTTNFLNGLPVYACCIGVLYRGWPLAGALYIPWPKEGGGFILHCRRGGGCFADGAPTSVYQSEEPVPNRLIGLPGSFGQGMKFSGRLGGKAGEMRTAGSIGYELAMAACGVMQYTIISAPRMWDMLAGSLAVMESGGTVMARLPGRKGWQPLEALVPGWEDRTPTMAELRKWVCPLVAGNQQVAPLVARNLRHPFRPWARLKALKRRVLSPRQHG